MVLQTPSTLGVIHAALQDAFRRDSESALAVDLLQDAAYFAAYTAAKRAANQYSRCGQKQAVGSS